MIDKKWKRIYVERKIKELIKARYPQGLNLNSSYIYQKMGKLVDKKIYVPIWNIWYYAHEQGFVNIFELHKRLDDMIRIHHLPQRSNSVYTNKEKKYMEEYIRSRKISEDRGLYITY
jgi:hypothetical protein